MVICTPTRTMDLWCVDHRSTVAHLCQISNYGHKEAFPSRYRRCIPAVSSAHQEKFRVSPYSMSSARDARWRL
jgi:hypothetical protein